jgi:glycosyltransferase involved in cell wall biosynthesis
VKILYLYSDLSPYLRPLFAALVKNHKIELHVVHWDDRKLTPYQPVLMDGVTYYRRSEYNLMKLRSLVKDIDPKLIFVVGWVDFDYLKIVRKARSAGVPVVVGFDGTWRGTLRQIFGSILIKAFRKIFFSHAFVSFSRQYEYAKKFGFHDEEIIFNALSCDTELFDKALSNLENKSADYPHIFIYAGRFSKEKGINELVEAFKIYRDEQGGKWKLLCVGNGNLQHLLLGEENIDVIDFVSQEELILLFNGCGALIMPGYLDPSPLAVHEATCACLPLILSTDIGNRSTFLIDGFNGFTFNSKLPVELATAMSKISALTDMELLTMSSNSHILSTRVTPDISAASLVSVLTQDRAPTKQM